MGMIHIMDNTEGASSDFSLNSLGNITIESLKRRSERRGHRITNVGKKSASAGVKVEQTRIER